MKKLFRAIEIIEIAILTGGVIFLSGFLFVNVVARELGNSIIFAEEISLLIMLLVIFFGLSYAARRGRHIRIGILDELPSKKIKKILTFIINAGSAVVMFYCGYLAIRYVQGVVWSGELSPALLWPYYLFVIWAPIGFGLAGIQYVRAFIKNVKEIDELWLSVETKTVCE